MNGSVSDNLGRLGGFIVGGFNSHWFVLLDRPFLKYEAVVVIIPASDL